MANHLPIEKQAQVIGCLTEGCGIRSVERLLGTHRDTIMRLGVRVGEGCAHLHDAMMVDLNVSTIEIDELWAFNRCKQRNARPLSTDGDWYTFLALSLSERAILSYRTGKRNDATAREFVWDLRDRVLGNVQITSDAFSILWVTSSARTSDVTAIERVGETGSLLVIVIKPEISVSRRGSRKTVIFSDCPG